MIDKKFLYYWFEFDKELIKKAHGTGTAMMHVSKSSMENRKLRLPSLNKQKQIAKINNMWAIINTGGSANLRHQHGNSTISGAYYVRAPENSGDIIFYDPRPAPVYSHPNAISPNSLNAEVNGVSPREGALVLFPSYLDHSVNENKTSQERIVISFNIRITI